MTEDKQLSLLRKIRALLDKAESTEYPEEADSLVSKAQELMSRYSIDEALLAKKEQRDIGKLVELRIDVENPYAHAKSRLLGAIADNNGLRYVSTFASRHDYQYDENGRYLGTKNVIPVWLLGYEADVEIAQALYTSLSLQAARALLAARKTKDSGVHSKTWSNSFLMGYASAVRRRLSDARVQAEKQAAGVVESVMAVVSGTNMERESSVELVLLDKQAHVTEYMYQKYPYLRPGAKSRRGRSGRGYTPATESSGYSAGSDAGRSANLGTSNLGRGVKGVLTSWGANQMVSTTLSSTRLARDAISRTKLCVISLHG